MERKIWSNIKKSQNIMNMIVGPLRWKVTFQWNIKVKHIKKRQTRINVENYKDENFQLFIQIAAA